MMFRQRSGRFHKYIPLVAFVVLLIGGLTLFDYQFSPAAHTNDPVLTSDGVPTAPLAPVYQYLPDDEQAGITFGQNFTGIAFNVTAIAQSDPSTDVGPAYLLNGLTNTGYWYQVGLSYKWPDPNGRPLPGFNMSYEVFNNYTNCNQYTNCNCLGSIFPSTCGAGIANLKVNPGDKVLLSLSFSNRNVMMRTTDWNTHSTMSENYTDEGATYFVGLPNMVSQHGFFTGLMTEQYFASPHYGSGQPVTYQQNGIAISSAMMWVDEFDTVYGPLFSDQTPNSINFTSTPLLQYFSSHGTAEVASGNELVTGLNPITLPTLTSSTSSTYRPGQQASLSVSVDDPSRLTITITSLDVSGAFGTFDVTSSAPLNISTNSIFAVRVTIPSNQPNGTYTLVISASFQFQDPQVPDSISAQPLYTSVPVTVSGKPVPPPNNRTTTTQLLEEISNLLLPAILTDIAAGIAAVTVVALVLRRDSLTMTHPTATFRACWSCGGTISQNMTFCPSCGTPQSVPENQVRSDPPNEPP